MDLSLVHLRYDATSALITSCEQEQPGLGLKIQSNFWNVSCHIDLNKTVVLKSTE